MRVLKKENGDAFLENAFYNIHIVYSGDDYERDLAEREFSARNLTISFWPKKEIPFSIDFVLKNGSIDQNIGIRFDSEASIPLTAVDDLCEALKGAKGTVNDVMEALDEYFPGVLREECLNRI